MSSRKTAPYGSWQSPITSDMIVAGSVGIGEIRLDGEDIYWTEMRPSEGGRNVVVRRAPGGQTSDVTPPPFNHSAARYCSAPATAAPARML